MKLVALPTWLVIRTIIWSDTLPVRHPYYQLPIPLWLWNSHQTYLCRALDLLLWVSIGSIILGITVV